MATKGNDKKISDSIYVNTISNNVDFIFDNKNKKKHKSFCFNVNGEEKVLIIPLTRLEELIKSESDNNDLFHIHFNGKKDKDECYRFCSLVKIKETIMETKDPIFHLYLNKIFIQYILKIKQNIISSLSFSYSNDGSNISGIHTNPNKLTNCYRTELSIPLSITQSDIGYFDLYYEINYEDKTMFPNSEKRKKRIYYDEKYYEKVQYFLINSSLKIEEQLINQLTSQIYSTENINIITVTSILEIKCEYVLFDTNYGDDETKFKNIINDKNNKLSYVNSLVIDLSTEENLKEAIDYFVKDSYNKILIYRFCDLQKHYSKTFDITEYDYLSKALYKE